ncbi:Dus-domain-containing protein [Metschnikowia bicuspidata var. bicuspidata NRRL YB-4993]|uniref:tRNA-dihydrouridine(47) synthase [NAD(P)(+)] n=1 Tax=Metschnikowia bicuspidata var. bicuspidata NRRL YB-4993 TaxID=869754 RepID=A0A1A0HEW4_9ASCO|nr:Dus-domain-containing protein [Metschnikowia bicuspidata var. bicuspidata NRRL YB-4993]OBA22515.1 Dus-domain-containing protein [Metschnikowia bicuspidata var. bicuspidata NRRL YB-4993]
MTEAEKRPVDSADAPEPKRPQRLSTQKGFAPIKPEYILESTTTDEAYDDEAAEGGDRDQADQSKRSKKGRGQNKKRDLKQQKEDIRLCSSVLDPGLGKECAYGEKCKNTHDVDSYLQLKPEDIAGDCPVFRAIGYCPAGIKCRWLGSHYNKETRALAKDLALMEAQKESPAELNKIDPAHRIALQKNRYLFDKASVYNKYLDSFVQNDANLARKQEDSKNNMASYVEPPFAPAEKKRVHLRGAKIVSPLTTVGNLPYRRLMKTLGADITYSEMALALPLLQGTKPEWALPKAHRSECPGFGVQIASNHHQQASKAAEALARETTHVSELNLNSGCPIDLLYRQGQGSALLDQPLKMVRILNGMNACSGDIPVTLKIRTGTKDSKNTAASLVSRVLAETHVAAITLHGRSRQQRYTREADWNYIAEVGKVVQDWNHANEQNKDLRDAPPTWFVGNGDCFTFEQWHDAVNTEGIDSVMVARGALIKPWIFEEIDAQQYLDKSATERLEYMRQFADFAVEHWGSDEYGIENARRYMCEFIGFTHRYIPVGILERLPPKLNERPPKWKGRNELETLLGSTDYRDWIKITEMFLGKASSNFLFVPKHKSNAYESK